MNTRLRILILTNIFFFLYLINFFIPTPRVFFLFMASLMLGLFPGTLIGLRFTSPLEKPHYLVRCIGWRRPTSPPGRIRR